MYAIIPLSGIPNNETTYRIPVNNGNISLKLRLTYNEISRYWSVDITNRDGAMLISALPLVPGQNILEQYEYMNVGGAWVIPRSSVKEEWPSYSTLTSNWYLIWSDTHAGG